MSRNTTLESKQLALKVGLNGEEWDLACEILGRVPNEAELHIYSALWSEDLSYKSTLPLLRRLFRGEDVQEDDKVRRTATLNLNSDYTFAAKVRSSEPWMQRSPEVSIRQDIETVIAELCSEGIVPSAILHFCSLGYAENVVNQELLRRLISESAAYCNSVGVPCIDIGLYFHPAFDKGPVVNTCAIGLSKQTKLPEKQSHTAIGDTVYYLGEPSGNLFRGASDAAQAEVTSFLPRNGNPVPTLRMTLALSEAIQSGAIGDVVWLGKGGLATACFHLAAKSGKALKIELDKIPSLPGKAKIDELLLFESPRRALFVASRTNYRKVAAIFERWGLDDATVGEVIEGDGMQFTQGHKVIADVPLVRSVEVSLRKGYQLVEFPPMIKKSAKLKSKLSDELKASLALDPSDREEFSPIVKPEYLEDVWLDTLGNPNFCSRASLLRGYDIGIGNRLIPGVFDARLLAILSEKDFAENSALALTLVTKPLYLAVDSYLGAVHCLAEGMRNLASVGAHPLAVLDCIDAGSPGRYKELCNIAECIRGLNDACQYWNIPILSDFVRVAGSADLSIGIAVPSILMLGVSSAAGSIPQIGFRDVGDIIFVVGDTKEDVNCSDYAYYCQQQTGLEAPDIDFEHERFVCEVIAYLESQGALKSLHRVASGGLAVALAECCMQRDIPLGASVEIKADVTEGRDDFAIFSETPGRFILSFAPEHEATIRKYFTEHNLLISGVGLVGGKTIGFSGSAAVEISLSTAYKVWASRLTDILEEERNIMSFLA